MLKNIVLIFTIILITSSLYAQDTDDSAVTTYYLIRHAEKDRSNPSNKNPNLTEKGKKRALKWSEVLNPFGIDAVYSTNYNRTLNTARPTANANNLIINTYHPFKINIQQFLKDTKGKSVLIVGHSNTTANFANKLIGKEIYPEIKDDNNANLYIITINGDKIEHVLIKMK